MHSAEKLPSQPFRREMFIVLQPVSFSPVAAKGHAGLMPGDSLIGNQTQTMRNGEKKKATDVKGGKWDMIQRNRQV